MRPREDAEALEQLAWGTLKLAQLLGITTEAQRCITSYDII